MASIESLDELLVSELRDLYDAEQRLTKAIPKLVEATSSSDLSNALDNTWTKRGSTSSGWSSRLRRSAKKPRLRPARA